MTLVLHLALPEELTLPLVVLLACVVVLDLQIPLGPLLYFVSHIFDAKIGHGESYRTPLFCLAPTGALQADPSKLFHITSSKTLCPWHWAWPSGPKQLLMLRLMLILMVLLPMQQQMSERPPIPLGRANAIFFSLSDGGVGSLPPL